MPILANTNLLDGDLLYEGQIAYTEDTIIRTGYNAEASAILPFGRMAAKGAATTGSTNARIDLINMVDANSIMQGIPVASDAIEKITGTPGTDLNVSVVSGVMGYPVDAPVSYLVRGVIGVRVAAAVTPSSDVYVVHTASSGIVVGTFRPNNTNAIQLTGAKFLGYGAQDDIVPLSINMA